VLDAYLNEANSEALIKDAIELTKPYFFNTVLAPRLTAEARRVLDGFKAEGTATEVLHFYFMNTYFPDVRTAAISQRMLKFNENRDKLQYLEELFPANSRRYAIKNHLSKLGSSESAIRTTQDLERLAKEQYG